MIAYTGIETVSNLAEEARDPVRSIPKAISWVAIAVFAIYFTLPWIALSAMPVVHQGGHYVTQARPAAARRLQERPRARPGREPRPARRRARDREGLRRDPRRDDPLHRHERGVIGASRITYSMASYRQLPEVFRRLHPKLKTPLLALVVFSGVGTTIFLLSGQVDFLGRMYAFGAMLSFTIAHASVIALRIRHRDAELEWRARPNLRYPRHRLAALRDRRRPRHRRRLARRRRPGRADPLRRPRLADRRLRLLPALPPPPAGAADADDARAGAARPGAGARVPLDPRPGRQRPGSRTRRSTSRCASPPSAPGGSCCCA